MPSRMTLRRSQPGNAASVLPHIHNRRCFHSKRLSVARSGRSPRSAPASHEPGLPTGVIDETHAARFEQTPLRHCLGVEAQAGIADSIEQVQTPPLPGRHRTPKPDLLPVSDRGLWDSDQASAIGTSWSHEG